MIKVSDKYQKFLIISAGSILFHLTIFAFFKAFFFTGIDSQDMQNQKMFEVEKISANQLKKLRTVGVKNGRKQFSTKMPQKKNLSMAALKAQSLSRSQLDKITKKESSSSSSAFLIKEKGFRRSLNSKLISNQVKKDLSSYSANKSILQKSDFTMAFEPPEGVSEDELNSTEKIFYSFYKRSYEVYYNSFLAAYNQLITSKPYLKNQIINSSFLLKGKVTFDEKGNILSLKIYKWSDDDTVYNLFESTLKGIKVLKNPPNELLDKKKKFSIYYTLRIN